MTGPKTKHVLTRRDDDTDGEVYLCGLRLSMKSEKQYNRGNCQMINFRYYKGTRYCVEKWSRWVLGVKGLQVELPSLQIRRGWGERQRGGGEGERKTTGVKSLEIHLIKGPWDQKAFTGGHDDLKSGGGGISRVAYDYFLKEKERH